MKKKANSETPATILWFVLTCVLFVLAIVTVRGAFNARLAANELIHENATTIVQEVRETVLNARDEYAYREKFFHIISENPAELVRFLHGTGKLSDIGVNPEDDIEEIILLLSSDEEARARALEVSKEVYDETSIGCDWVKVRRLNTPTPVTPLATSAETGKPIANDHNHPAGPWAGPDD